MTIEPYPLAHKVAVPRGDDADATQALVVKSLDVLTEALEEIRKFTHAHETLAPISAVHTSALVAAMAGVALDWIEEWPT